MSMETKNHPGSTECYGEEAWWDCWMASFGHIGDDTLKRQCQWTHGHIAFRVAAWRGSIRGTWPKVSVPLPVIYVPKVGFKVVGLEIKC